MKYKKIRIHLYRNTLKDFFCTGEMAQWFQTLATLSEYLGSISRTHMGVHNHL